MKQPEAKRAGSSTLVWIGFSKRGFGFEERVKK